MGYDESQTSKWLQENNLEVNKTVKASWTVVDFRELTKVVEVPKFSTTFSCKNSYVSTLDFIFKFDARNKEKYDDDYLQFCTRYSNDYPSMLRALLYRVKISNCNFEECFLRASNIYYSYFSPCIAKLSYYQCNNNYIFENGTYNLELHFEVDILFEKPKPIPIEPRIKLIDTVDIQGHVLENCQNLLESGDYSDFVLLVGGTEFRVHKNILLAQSEVFKTMFNTDLDEKKMNRAEITDIEVDVCQQMLNYIYGGKVDKLAEMALDLMVAADKYQLKHLKSVCERSLSLSLSTESVVKALVLADMHQAEELKAECIDFICKHSSAVKSFDSWNQMKSRPELLMELFDKMSSKST